MQKTIAVVTNYQKPEAPEFASAVEAELRALGYTVLSLDASRRRKKFILQAKKLFLVITIGGDGTVLGAARDFPQVPVLAVNLGHMGFVTGTTVSGWRALFDAFAAGSARFSNRLMLQVEVVRNGATVFHQCGLNEVVLNSKQISRLVDLRVRVGEDDLGRFRADGVMVATPTGSTAYSAAAGGPVLAPEMSAFVITPICPFALGSRPIVIGSDSLISIQVPPAQAPVIRLTVDGQIGFPLQPDDSVRVQQAPFPCCLVEGKNENFYQALREKLHWSGGQHD